MVTSGPSHTALLTAYARAYHQIADRPLIFTDPLAAPLLGVTAEELNALSSRSEDPLATAMNDQARRQFFAARARFAEDAVTAAVTNGTRQVVVLGAGLDTFAYRNTIPDLQVFEIDHPATQEWKCARLSAAGIVVPDTLSFVPVDFETQDLATELENTAFSRTDSAVFVWLGVIFYLTAQTAHTTLEYIANQGRTVEVVFDYLQAANTDQDRMHLQARSDRLATTGEPFFTYFTSDEIAKQLTALGFTHVEDHTAQDIISAYIGESTNYSTEPARTLRASRLLRASR